MTDYLGDKAAERGVLAGICRYGNDAYLEVADMVQESTFTDKSNKIIFKCLKHILENDDSADVDVASIHSAGSELGVGHILSKPSEGAHLAAIFKFPVVLTNIRKFAAKIRKFEITRLLHDQLEQAQDQLLEIEGHESITHILGIAEETVFDFTSLLNDGADIPTAMSENIDDYVQDLIDNPVEQIGLSTGFKNYDKAIGGGLRPGAISIVGARMKVGKTVFTDNVGYHVAGHLETPVLNLDTEMMKEDHVCRSLAMLSSVEINRIATGQFGQCENETARVKDAADKLKKTGNRYMHKSIAGMPFEEQLAVMRRWVTKEVGLNDDGTAKNCLIIYDYLKLMNSGDVSGALQEYQILGFMMTSLHNFAVRYKVPLLVLIQLNRDGIEKEGTDVASGSDRIGWLCSNLTIYKPKSAEEITMDGGPEQGTHKLVPIVARHGPGMSSNNYINCVMKGSCAQIRELKTKHELERERELEATGFELQNSEYDPDQHEPIEFK